MTLQNDLIVLTKRNRDGSYNTQAKRVLSLRNLGRELKTIGYRLYSARSLKPKHIEALVQHWQNKELSNGTMKNKMAHLRWWAEKIGKPGIIMRDNFKYGIHDRVHVSNVSKAQKLDESKLLKINDEHVKASLILQREFGLRREEAIKFDAHYAVKENHIVLKASWCKGGKQRTIPIETDTQRQALDNIRKVSINGCLIPPSKNYVQQLKKYENETIRVGLNKMHGLRHQYAQDKFKRLTGYDAPVNGGPKRKDMTPEERKKDTQARIELSKVLGHERMQIVAVYIGS